MKNKKMLPSIEIKSNYIHKGTVGKMIKVRKKAGVLPIGMLTTNKISKPARKLLDEHDIAWAEIPETEIREKEHPESERSE